MISDLFSLSITPLCRNANDVIEKQKEKEKIARLQDSQAEVFEEVKDRRPQEVTSGDIKNALKIGDRSALRSLRALERKGLLISETRRTDKKVDA